MIHFDEHIFFRWVGKNHQPVLFNLGKFLLKVGCTITHLTLTFRQSHAEIAFCTGHRTSAMTWWKESLRSQFWMDVFSKKSHQTQGAKETTPKHRKQLEVKFTLLEDFHSDESWHTYLNWALLENPASPKSIMNHGYVAESGEFSVPDPHSPRTATTLGTAFQFGRASQDHGYRLLCQNQGSKGHKHRLTFLFSGI